MGVGIAWLVVTVLLAAWTRGVVGSRRDQQKAALSFARYAGLTAEDPPEDRLVRRVIRRHRFVLAGVLAGLAAGWLVSDSAWVGLSLLWVGLAAGAVAARLTEPGPPPGSPRFAHTTETRLTDYVPPWTVALNRLATAAVLALAGYALVTPRPPVAGGGLSDAGVAGVAALSLAALVLAEGLARTVLARRRAAASAADLAVDDALRASALRDCLQLSAAVSFGAVAALSLAFGVPDVADLPRRIGGWAPGVMLVAIVVARLTFHATRGAGWWRRLHPVAA